MKLMLCSLCLFLSFCAFSQTTHSVTVHINQPAVCSVVSTEQSKREEPMLYPNPATTTIFLRNIEANTRVEILDALGRNVFANFLESENSISIDVERLTRGMYHVILRHPQKNHQLKAILE